MKLNKAQKKQIKASYKTTTAEEIAKIIKASRKDVEEYLKEAGKDTTGVNIEASGHIKTWEDLKNFFFENQHYILLISFLILFVFANSLFGEFVSDDIPAIIQDPNAQNIQLALKDMAIHKVIYAILYSTLGLNKFFFHLVSLIFHGINAILLLILVSNLFNKKVGLFASLIFAVNPITVESVAWISALTYVINAMAILTTLNIYTIYVFSGNKKYYYASLLIFALGLAFLKNPWFITLYPILFLLRVFLINKKITLKELILEGLPFVILTGLYAFYMLNFVQNRLQAIGTVGLPSSIPIHLRFPYQIVKYLSLLAFPLGLSFYHEGIILSQTQYLISVIFTIIFFAILVVLLLRKKKVAFGLLSLIIVGLTLSLVPLTNSWLIAERYMYTSTMFYSLLLALIFIKLFKDKTTLISLLVLLLALFSIRSLVRNNDFRTPKNLWMATDKTAPLSAKNHNNLGDSYATEENYEQAIKEFQRATELQPAYADAHYNMGNTYIRMGEYGKAAEKFEQVLQIQPQQYLASYNLGALYYQAGDKEKAKELMSYTLSINPNYEGAKKLLEVLNNETVK